MGKQSSNIPTAWALWQIACNGKLSGICTNSRYMPFHGGISMLDIADAFAVQVLAFVQLMSALSQSPK